MSSRSVGKPSQGTGDSSDFAMKQPPRDILPPPPAIPSHMKDEYFDQLPEEHEEVVYSPPRTTNPVLRVINLATTFFLVHYLFWFPWLLATIGFLEYAGVWQAKWVFVAFLAVYIPIVFDGSEYRTGKGWNAARMGSYWLAAHDYAKVEIKRTTRLDSKKTYLISVYGGAFERLFPGIQHRTLGATPMFYWLFCRLFSMWMGAVDAGKKTATRVLKAGYSLMVFPGGSREIFTTDPECNTVTFVLKPRKGFVKLALRHGTHLVPVVVYGEKYVYSRWIAPEWLVQFCLKRFKGFPLLVFWGRFFTLLPYRSPLRVVYGAPIEVKQVDEPSAEDVDVLHATYVEAAKELWHAHKAWGYGSAEKAAKEELIIQ